MTYSDDTFRTRIAGPYISARELGRIAFAWNHGTREKGVLGSEGRFATSAPTRVDDSKRIRLRHEYRLNGSAYTSQELQSQTQNQAQEKDTMDENNRITITVCGDGGCGKSSITLRLVRSQWTSEYDPTIGTSPCARIRRNL